MRAPEVLKGWIGTYWETGMEEPPRLIFQDERFTEGKSWAMEGMHELRPGHHLTIYAPDGDLLWEGTLGVKRRSWFGPAHLVPPEIDHWFHLHPPLRAELRISGSNC